jgi:hypothetical protein
MATKAKPTRMLWTMPAGWINRHQQDLIMYIEEENEVLQERLGYRLPPAGGGLTWPREAPELSTWRVLSVLAE